MPTKAVLDNRIRQIYNGAEAKANIGYFVHAFKRFEDAVQGSREFLSQMKPAKHITLDTAVKTGRVIIQNNNAVQMFWFDHVGAYNDIPENFSALVGKGGFVHAVVHGYQITIILESNESEVKLKEAAEHLLEKKNLSDEDIKILQQSKAYVHYLHPFAASVSADDKNGYERLRECESIMTRPYPLQGVPIYFFVEEIKAKGHETYKPVKEGRLDFSFLGQAK